MAVFLPVQGLGSSVKSESYMYMYIKEFFRGLYNALNSQSF